jgi:two-component system chemotaxis sensor kinase CheA
MALSAEDLEMLNGFIGETRGILEQAEGILVRMEGKSEELPLVTQLFGLIHTIKGTSGFFEPKTLHNFAHELENTFSKIKTGALPIGPTSVTALLQGFDTLKVLTNLLEKGEGQDFDCKTVLAQIEAQASAAAKTEKAAPESTAQQAIAVLTGDAPVTDVKVSIQLLDQFIGLAGESMVIRNMVNKLLEQIEITYPRDASVAQLAELFEEMSAINTHVQSQISDLKKVPMKTVMRTLRRAVRDTAVLLGKEIRLVIEGEDLRVDTAIAEAFSQSLIHMVRNCVDHAIEKPDVRTSVGKPAVGTIVIDCTAGADKVIVKIIDDGRGIDPKVILKKAIEVGLVTEESSKSLSTQQIFALIFEAGFSTAEKVTDVSGRGVGMDMVRSSITKLGGAIRIDSEIGKGTTFTLTVPVPRSVSMYSSLLVQADKNTYAIPSDKISKILFIDPSVEGSPLRYQGKSRLLVYEGRLIPLIRLDDLLKQQTQAAWRDEGVFTAIVVESNFGEFGIVVDSIGDLEDTVVKQLPPCLKNLTIYLGSTFLGEANIGLILDTDVIAQKLGIVQAPKSESPMKTDQAVADVTREDEVAFLSFKAEQSGAIYAVPLGDVFRIEELSLLKTEMSGAQEVIRYRNAIMRVSSFNELFEDVIEQKSPQQLLVFRMGDQFEGIKIAEVLDIGVTQSPVIEDLEHRRGVSGSRIVDERVMTFLDVNHLLKESA